MVIACDKTVQSPEGHGERDYILRILSVCERDHEPAVDAQKSDLFSVQAGVFVDFAFLFGEVAPLRHCVRRGTGQ